MPWSTIGTHLLAALIGAGAGAVLQYYLGKKRDTVKIHQEKELEKTAELDACYQNGLRELHAFRADVNDSEYDDRQQLKEKAQNHASKMENHRDAAPPEISPDVVRHLEKYCEAVEELNYSEVFTSTVNFGHKSPFEKQRQQKKQEKRKQERKQRFQERLDTYNEAATTLESKLKKNS